MFVSSVHFKKRAFFQIMINYLFNEVSKTYLPEQCWLNDKKVHAYISVCIKVAGSQNEVFSPMFSFSHVLQVFSHEPVMLEKKNLPLASFHKKLSPFVGNARSHLIVRGYKL